MLLSTLRRYVEAAGVQSKSSAASFERERSQAC